MFSCDNQMKLPSGKPAVNIRYIMLLVFIKIILKGSNQNMNLWTYNKNALTMTRAQGRPLIFYIFVLRSCVLKDQLVCQVFCKTRGVRSSTETYFPWVPVQLLRQTPSLFDINEIMQL